MNYYTHFSPANYLKNFSNTTTAVKERLLSKPLNFHGREAVVETVAITFQITFQQVQKQSPPAISLLKIIACVDHRGIPHELLARGGLDDEIILGEALSKLINLSFLTARDVRTYDMHSLVHLSLQEFLSPHDMATSVKCTAEALAAILPSGNVKNWPVWKVYFPHAFSLARNVKEESKSTLSIYDLMFFYLMGIGNYKEAENQSRRSAREGKILFGKDHSDTLTSMGNLASACRRQGRWKEAEELEVKVLETRKRVLGQEHQDTLLTMGNLAWTYWDQGRWKEAEELQVEVLEARKKVLVPEHPSTLSAMGDLASTYRAQGRLEDAEALGVKVLETRKKVLGQEHPDTLRVMGNLALTYRDQGRWEDAEGLEMEEIETRKRVLACSDSSK